MENYLRKLIEEGENQHLDFKYCVSDSRKIARTLVAFSNTDGGRLLIGVRDNGSIAGIQSDEEIYMVDTAAHLFCRPEISYSIKQHTSGTKTLLEVEVLRGSKRPYQVKDESGRWLAYFRHNDQNLLANRILLQVWRKEEKKSGVMVRFGKAENALMDFLTKNGSVTFSRFRKIAKISSYRAESIIANLLIFKVLIMKASEKGFTYELNPDDPLQLLNEKTSFNIPV
ncbi:MAG TPA: ATP-binding protein [Bacteroidales bacterium]|nr:ATP-binding protein [Bacteroidales bacterium]HOX76317.1 ATP-binding protein [Bacteroidales bacterium]HPM88702.1 ATP-binding protein [Bacteroidales bacterium]HQM70031.1 ATP-binding protein [Bacteroidales bacterium]